MTLYVFDKQTAQYKPLSVAKIKKLRRADEIKELCRTASQVGPTMRALSCWLSKMRERGNKMTTSDLVVTRTPNCERITQLMDQLDSAVDMVKNA